MSIVWSIGLESNGMDWNIFTGLLAIWDAHSCLLYTSIKYGRIKKRRGHKKAIIAIARMMMVCIYHMVSEKKPFTPADYEELMKPQNHVERVVLNENNVFAYLESLGYDSSKLVKRNDN